MQVSREVVMHNSTLPLFPSDDGWPYPDRLAGLEDEADAPDFDALEMLGPHVFDSLSEPERQALFLHFGLRDAQAYSMKELGPQLGCSRREARHLLGSAIDKMREKFASG
jgi:DNA-directed RNA polymerase sigma subunit (sigma70/sigma32)